VVIVVLVGLAVRADPPCVVVLETGTLGRSVCLQVVCAYVAQARVHALPRVRVGEGDAGVQVVAEVAVADGVDHVRIFICNSEFIRKAASVFLTL